MLYYTFFIVSHKCFQSVLTRGLFDRKGRPVNMTFQITPSPNFFFAINQKGALSEMGWFLYPTFRFMAWQAQW